MQSRIQQLMLTLLALFLTACGSGISGGSGSQAISSSDGCITASCHGSLASKVTGRPIASEWRASAHFAAGVAGCRTCHGHSHQNSCQNCHGGGNSPITQVNQVVGEDSCLSCHVNASTLMKSLDKRHLPELNPKFRLNSGFNYYSAAGFYTMRGTAYESKCIWCHNPHDNRVLPQHNDWAESGHGNVNGGPFANRGTDFKTRGSSADWSQAVGDGCVRCHTTTGFINLVTSNMTNISPWGLSADGVTPISFTRQTLYCNVCHDNGSGKAYGNNMRAIPAQSATGGVRVYQNYSATLGTRITATSFRNATTNTTKTSITAQINPSDNNNGESFSRTRIVNNFIDFPDLGISGHCVLCHSGRASGSLIKLVAASRDAAGNPFNFRLSSRVGVHDFAGAGTMFRSLGFEFYSSFRYAQPSGIPYAHDLIGQGNFLGTGNRGPCVSCHMSSSKSHSFLPVDSTGTAVTSINTALCNNCHASGGIGNSRFNGTATDLGLHKAGLAAALKALTAWVNMKGLGSNTNWLRSSSYTGGRSNGADGTALAAAGFSQTACIPPADRSLDTYLGMRNMGASLNQNFINNEPAAYVHNDLYVKRLIYDSLDWLDNCVMDKSVEGAINLTSNTSIFLGSNDRLSAADKSAAINYLMGGPGNGRPGGN